MQQNDNAGKQQAPEKTKTFAGEVINFLKAFVIALAIVFLLTTFVFQIIVVDGPSMMNTLKDREFMFVSKIDYVLGEPDRFDVVICHFPDRGQTNFVKRIVGIPGDTVAVYNGILYLNGEVVEEAYVDYPPHYTMEETLVEEGHYFVLGDNRAVSGDSHRPEIGQLTRKQIRGKVRFILWPISEWRVIR